MSDTQQEIATPQACKQRKRPLLLGLFALIFIVLAVVGCLLLSNNAVAVMLILIALSFALAIISIFAVNGNRMAIKIILDVLTGGVALVIISRFYVTMEGAKNPTDNIVFMATTFIMAVALICLNIVKVYDSPKDAKRTTRYLTYAATFIALSVLFKLLGNTVSSIVIIPNMKLSFVYIPWVLSGIVLGPIGGVLTALISDVLGQLTIAVGGAINPLTMLSNALFPLAPALIFRLARRAPDWLKAFVGMFISLAVCTMGIGSAALFWQYEYYNTMSFWTYLLTIRSPQMIIIAINYFLTLLLLPVVKKIRLRERLGQAE